MIFEAAAADMAISASEDVINIFATIRPKTFSFRPPEFWNFI
jgi:hypothetical protein